MSESETGSAPAAARVRVPGGAKTGHVLRRAGIAIALLVAGGAIALTGEHLMGNPAVPDETRVMTFQDWRLVCPPASQKDARCTLGQDVVRDQGGTLVSLSMDNSAAGSPLTVTVPHGVLLDPGLGFSAGNDPMKVHPYETCTPVGCLSLVAVDADMLKALRGNANGQVVVVPGNGSPVTIPFSLRGFSEGYAELVKEDGRRTSMWGFLAR